MPKELQANLQWRMTLRRQADSDDDFRRTLMSACRLSDIYWINAFGWTYRHRYVNEKGETVPAKGHQAHYPMITWPVQDESLQTIGRCIRASEDANIDKSRDMGATWLVIFKMVHGFLFEPEHHYGLVSRKEELVDKRGDMDSLFEKARYILKQLPQWMLPVIRQTHMLMVNRELNSSIAGESTNTDIGRGGRKLAYAVDEAAAIPNGEQVETSLSQTTGCQIWVSTPKGPLTQFHKRIKESRGVHVILPWYRHPEKAQGATQIRDELGHVKWTSPWYRRQEERASRKMLAQEVDMSHGQAGDVFFDYHELERHRQDHAREPRFCGDLLFVGGTGADDQIRAIRECDESAFQLLPNHGQSPWRFWLALEDGRPPQHTNYVAGIDVSNGAGGSNSVLTVLDAGTGRVVAKWWSANVSPEQFAIEAMSAGVWFGGLAGAMFLCWENNGPGGIFGRRVVKATYPHYYIQRQEGHVRSDRSNRYGWHSSRTQKELLMGIYRDALATNKAIVPCHQSLDEAGDYVYENGTGRLIPSRLREESEGGRDLHGDHVIADALAVLALEEAPKQRHNERRAPHGSYAARKKYARSISLQKDPWK